MEDKIIPFRQPMVTASGLILGFLLNFLATLVKSDSPLQEWISYFVGACVLCGVINLILVLYRVLNMNYPREKGSVYYNRTLTLFITGVSVSFLGVFIDMFSNFMIE